MDPPGAHGLQGRVDTEQNCDGFGPFGTIGSGIKQPHVELDMSTIIFGQIVANRRDVVEGGERGCHVEDRHKTQAAAADR